MAHTARHIAQQIGTHCRDIAVTVIGGVWRARPLEDIDAAVKSRPTADQVLICLGVFGVLFGLSLVAAQIGWVAMLLFWLAVILIVN